MSSSGAPARPADPRYLLDYWDDPALGNYNASSHYGAAAVGKARKIVTATGEDISQFYTGSAGATRVMNANGIPAWHTSDAIGSQGRINNDGGLSFPVSNDYFTAPLLPSALIRHLRFTYEFAVMRNALGAGAGWFQVGIMGSALGLPANNNQLGICLLSQSTLDGGNWAVAWRIATGVALQTQLLGINPAGQWARGRIRMVTGPVARSLTVEVNGTLAKTFASADLPLGSVGGQTGYGPGFYSTHTVAAGGSYVTASRFTVEEL